MQLIWATDLIGPLVNVTPYMTTDVTSKFWYFGLLSSQFVWHVHIVPSIASYQMEGPITFLTQLPSLSEQNVKYKN